MAAATDRVRTRNTAYVQIGVAVAWMVRRAWRGFRAITVRPTRQTANEGRV